MKVIILFLSITILTSCGKAIYYYEGSPLRQNTVSMQMQNAIHYTVSLAWLEEMREGKEVLFYPHGVSLVDKHIFEPNTILSIELKVANPLRERISIVFIQSINGKAERLILYEGSLPYRMYEIRLPSKGGDALAYFEIYKDEQIIGITPKANYTIK